MLLGLTSAACIGTSAPAPKPTSTLQDFTGGPFNAAFEIGDLTPAQIAAAAPETASCAGSGGECSTAEAAAKGLNDAFAAYGLKTLGQKAGMIGYMAFESVGFKWNTNQFPGRPGQGTKSMLMFAHLYNFAASFEELRPEVAKNSPGGQIAQVTWDNAEAMFSTEQKNAIRALVLPDNYTFKSAPWFLTSYPAATCDKSLLNNGFGGFESTMGLPCYGVTVDGERKARWCSTVKAIAPAGMDAPAECA